MVGPKFLANLLNWPETRELAKNYGARLRGKRESALQLPVAQAFFTAIDCEMTGLDLARDEILSIGAVRIKNGRLILGERYYRVFKPAKAVSTTEVILIHGLGHDEVSRGLPFAEALDELQAFLGDSILVTHFGSIDLEFLNSVLKKNNRPALKNSVLDTAKMAHWYREKMSLVKSEEDPQLRLEDLIEAFDLPRYPVHHAYYDALTTAQLFLKLAAHMESLGVIQLAGLFRIAGLP